MSKNTVDPNIDTQTWRLFITLDGKPLRHFSYAELLSLPKQIRYVTLRCISNTLKSDLMGTAIWAGVHLSQLIDRRTLPSAVIEAAFIGVEGHDDSLRIDYAYSDESLLTLGMNGKTLSRTHGFPIRLLAPNYYGCRNVKWIREIRFVTKPYYGTWQRLGYTKEPVFISARTLTASGATAVWLNLAASRLLVAERFGPSECAPIRAPGKRRGLSQLFLHTLGRAGLRNCPRPKGLFWKPMRKTAQERGKN